MKRNYWLPLTLLLVLLACLEQLQASGEDEDRNSGLPPVIRAFWKALETMDYRGNMLPHGEVLEKFKEYLPFFDPPPSFVLQPPFSKPDPSELPELTDLLDLWTGVCYSRSEVEQVNKSLTFIERESEVAYKLLSGVVNELRRLCEEEFQHMIQDLQRRRPNDWSLIQDLHRCYLSTGDHSEGTFGTRMLVKLVEMNLPAGEQQSERLDGQARKVLDEFEEACEEFGDTFSFFVPDIARFENKIGFRGIFGSEVRLLPSYWAACRAALSADKTAAVIRAVDTRCNVFQEAIDEFRASNPQDWPLISELGDNYRKLRSIQRAMQELLEKRFQEDRKHESRQEITRRAQDVAQAVKRACEKFKAELDGVINRASHSLLPEASRLSDYNAACEGTLLDFSKIEKMINDCFLR